MADYKELLRRAVEALPENNGAARRAVYEKARAALVGQLRAINPPLAARDITAHRLQIEDCIRQVEQEASEAVIAGLGSSKEDAPPPPPVYYEPPAKKAPTFVARPVAKTVTGGAVKEPPPPPVPSIGEIIAALEEGLASPQTAAQPHPADYTELLRRSVEALPEIIAALEEELASPQTAAQPRPADYTELLRRAIKALPENNGAARRAVYEKARATLVGQLLAIAPPLAARDITARRLELEDCIRQVEEEASEAVIAGLGSSKEDAPPPPPVYLEPPVKRRPLFSAPVERLLERADRIAMARSLSAGPLRKEKELLSDGKRPSAKPDGRVAPILARDKADKGRHLKPSVSASPPVIPSTGPTPKRTDEVEDNDIRDRIAEEISGLEDRSVTSRRVVYERWRLQQPTELTALPRPAETNREKTERRLRLEYAIKAVEAIYAEAERSQQSGSVQRGSKKSAPRKSKKRPRRNS